MKDRDANIKSHVSTPPTLTSTLGNGHTSNGLQHSSTTSSGSGGSGSSSSGSQHTDGGLEALLLAMSGTSKSNTQLPSLLLPHQPYHSLPPLSNHHSHSHSGLPSEPLRHNLGHINGAPDLSLGTQTPTLVGVKMTIFDESLEGPI